MSQLAKVQTQAGARGEGRDRVWPWRGPWMKAVRFCLDAEQQRGLSTSSLSKT